MSSQYFFFKRQVISTCEIAGSKSMHIKISLILAICPQEGYAHLNSYHQVMRQSVAYILAKLDHYKSY